MNKKILTCLALLLILVISGAALVVVHGATAVPEADEADSVLAARLLLFPEAAGFEATGTEGVAAAKNEAGEVIGYIADAETEGFNGKMELNVACDAEGNIRTLVIGGESFNETPGLGANARNESFTDQFIGKKTSVALTANGGEIDGITAATITSNAVMRGVNDALKRIGTAAGFAVEEKKDSAIEDLGGGRYANTVQGFGGPIRVEVAIDDQGAITEIVVGDDSFAETDGLGARTRDDEFKSQFIGKSGLLSLGGDIEAVSGATISSTAVTDAVNAILAEVNGLEAAPAQPAKEAPAAEVNAAEAEPEAAASAEGQTATASADGFGGPVAVTITAQDGKITAIEIGDDKFAESNGLGANALKDEFKQQFIGKSLPLDIADIDALSGATITTKAVVSAVNAAYETLTGK